MSHMDFLYENSENKSNLVHICFKGQYQKEDRKYVYYKRM